MPVDTTQRCAVWTLCPILQQAERAAPSCMSASCCRKNCDHMHATLNPPVLPPAQHAAPHCLTVLPPVAVPSVPVGPAQQRAGWPAAAGTPRQQGVPLRQRQLRQPCSSSGSSSNNESDKVRTEMRPNPPETTQRTKAHCCSCKGCLAACTIAHLHPDRHLHYY